MFNSKIFLAEFIGTFALVFIGAGAGLAQVGLLGVAFAHGLTVATFAYTFGYISGTHINPAVTFGLWSIGKVKGGLALVSYVLPQFLGAIVAAVFLKLLYGDISTGATMGYLTQASTVDSSRFFALLPMAVEAILTFFLMNAVLHNAVGGKSGQFAGLIIGLTLTAAILVGGPLTGASLNPARTFGPAIFTNPSFGNPQTYVIYFLGPLIGALLAVVVYNFFTDAEETVEEEIVVAEVVEEPVKAKKTTVRKTTKK
jgi:MIP family channel proteins